MKLTKIGVLIGSLFCVLNVHAIPGDLDTTFDTDGKTNISIKARNYAQDVAIQADGKIVVAGHSDDGTTPVNLDISLARFNTDGSLDMSFGTGGKVVVSASDNQRAFGVVIQADGKILLFGSDNGHLAAFRFNSDGSIDTAFGTNGKVVHIIGLESAASEAVVQTDGKFVLAGYVRFTNESYRFTVFRLNTDGSLDTGFNSNGYTPVLFGGTAAYSVALQADGKIIAGGWDTGDNFGYWGRFSTDGILEGGVSALVRTDVRINDVAIQADGKLVFAGYIRTIGTGITNFGITRYNTDRTLDVHFGNGGVNTVNWGSGTLHRATSLLIQPSGRIVVGGRALFPFDFGIARFNANGFLDVGFGNGGRVTTHFVESDEITGLAQQADGKIVAVGQSWIASGQLDYSLARYDGSDSNTSANRAQFDYDGDGRADISVFRPSTATWYIFNSSNSSVNIRTFGTNGDVPAPADFDGDAKTDLAIYRPSNNRWWWLPSNSGFAQQYPYLAGGNFVLPGDFTGDGRADVIAYTSSNGSWYRGNSFIFQLSHLTFGVAGDKPVLGDFDGDTKVDPAIYRPSTGEWWYAASSAGGQHRAARWGISTDIPVPADYDGDFKTDFAVYRASEGVWYIVNSSDGSYTIAPFGLADDKPVAADYDGDGKADIAVFRPSTGVWYLMQTTAGFSAIQWGLANDIPTPNSFVP